MNLPKDMAQNYVKAGKVKVALPTGKMFVLAIMAGIYISMGAAGFQLSTATFESVAVGKLVGACIFPIGLALVLLAGSELFTGNCLLVMPLLQKEITWPQLLRSWGIVYFGNFAGGIIIAAMVIYGNTALALDGNFLDVIMSTASMKIGLSFGETLIRGILCNMMVCLAVWVSFAATSAEGKVIVIFYPIMVFVLGGFEHCIADMYYLVVALFADAVYGLGDATVTVATIFTKSLIPSTIGNIIGGGGVGLAYWYIYLKGNKE